MESPATLRKCTRCGEMKQPAEFSRSRRGRDGLHSYCRSCMADYMTGRREHVGHVPQPCGWCKKDFTPKDVRARYCSNNCKMRARYWRLNPRSERLCPICSTDITNRRRDTEFCSEPCARENRRRDGRTKLADRKSSLKRYGLTPEEYAAKLAEQNGRCAICGTDEPGTHHGYWAVDHDQRVLSDKGQEHVRIVRSWPALQHVQLRHRSLQGRFRPPTCGCGLHRPP